MHDIKAPLDCRARDMLTVRSTCVCMGVCARITINKLFVLYSKRRSFSEADCLRIPAAILTR